MSAFADFCAGFFKRYFELHPTEAINYFVEGSLKRLRQVSVKGLTKDETIDYALLEGRLTIENYEFHKEDYRLKWPELPLPVQHIYILTVRPTNDIIGNLVSRLERSPAVLRQGIENLSRAEANP